MPQGQGNSANLGSLPDGRSTGRRGLQYVGEILVTLGAVLLLFAVYEVWWTNVVAQREISTARAEAEAIVGHSDFPLNPDGTPVTGTPFALLYVPRLHDHVWAMPIIQGVGARQLAKGVGHYPQTAMPGEIGNFAIAGHRATNGEPFANVDLLRAGDRVFVETPNFWYTYELQQDRIVSPDASWVIGPRPLPESELPSDRLITITTCHPRWGSTERWIWWGVQTEARPRSEGPPREVVEGA